MSGNVISYVENGKTFQKVQGPNPETREYFWRSVKKACIKVDALTKAIHHEQLAKSSQIGWYIILTWIRIGWVRNQNIKERPLAALEMIDVVTAYQLVRKYYVPPKMRVTLLHREEPDQQEMQVTWL